jgi:5-methyltetrahydropteroyltriglutamate--homocysteine methyltransferase
MKTNILGYPRIGRNRELKKACEAFWAGKIDENDLYEQGRKIRKENWLMMKEAGIDLIPSNDFSFYDNTLDMSLMLGAIPNRYNSLLEDKTSLHFAMARGIQNGQNDIIAMEMTKWFDTNYHYIVPEFSRNQQFSLFDTKAIDEFREAKSIGIITKPVLIGPVSFLLSGKEKEDGFNRLELIDRLLPTYIQIINALEKEGAEWLQIDEPYLALDLDDATKAVFEKAYKAIKDNTRINIILTTYFDGLKENSSLALTLPVKAIHIDLVRCPEQIDDVLNSIPDDKILSLGIVDGRNIWKNDYKESLLFMDKAKAALGSERILIAGSSSFLHVPYDLENETNESVLLPEIKRWMAFARQKVDELALLKDLASDSPSARSKELYDENVSDISSKHSSALVHNASVSQRISLITDAWLHRKSPFLSRSTKQHERLHLPLLPTTTIGSFPQTKEVRSWRSQFKKGEISLQEYEKLLKDETKKCIEWQESIGLDVLVHGEFERNDMVEYFGEQLDGFTFTQKGWVQSYGSRCVKPPVIFGDVSRPHEMTVAWSKYAQSLTQKPMKGMLTGPVTILEWSFVRNDQPRSLTCQQIALAMRDEVCDLEKAGIKIIQIDEPAIREGLPLRKSGWQEYLKWAVGCFRLTSSGVNDDTQIHTHMCYSEFNDIIEHIAKMDADVITIECSRSQMELLDVFGKFRYPNDIGPGVYDIHSARVPSVAEIVALLKKAVISIPYNHLWVNPDCGLKTRGWKETKESLKRMIEAAQAIRKEYYEYGGNRLN